MATKKSAKTSNRKPKRHTEPEGGPKEWLLPTRESAYTKLIPKAQAEAERAAAKAAKPAKAKGKKGEQAPGFHSTFQPGRGEDVLASLPRDYWLTRMQEFQRRKIASPRRGRGMRGPSPGPGSPIIPGTNNWIPLGPSVQ